MAKLNKVFKKYGHDCEMVDALDILPKFVRGNSGSAQFRRALIRCRLISEMHPCSKLYLRSQAAINHEKYVHLTTHPNMIHPFSEFKKWWSIIMGFIFLLQFITIPLDIIIAIIPGKVLSTADLTVQILRMFGDMMCLFDVVMGFFTGYYDSKQKKVILSPGKVFLKYLRTYFFFDALSSIPHHLNLVFPIPQIENRPVYIILVCSSLLKFVRINTFSQSFTLIREAFDIQYVIYRSIWLIVMVIIYYHMVTTLLLFCSAATIGYLTASNYSKTQYGNPSWITNDYLDGLTTDFYLIALFKACTIISVAGTGDNVPSDHTNFVVVMLFWLLSRLLFTVFVARLKQIRRALSSSHDKYEGMVTQLKEYMSDKELPAHMQKRILMYYEFRFQKSYFRENEILATISGQLRQEIILHNCRNLVEKVTFFKNLPSTLMIRITSCLYAEIFLPNDVIVYTNTKGNCMYFIATGTVAVYTASGKEIVHLEDGDHFGEVALVMEEGMRIASVVAVEICELYRLDRKDFIRAINPYPDLFEKIQKIAAERSEKTAILDERFRHTRYQIHAKQ